MRQRLSTVLGGAALVAVTLTLPTGAAPPETPGRKTDSPPATRVLLISVDGLNPRAIVRLGPRGAPSLHRIMRQGASTLNARTLVEETRTLPNHVGMVTGRRAALPQGTGVRYNADIGATVHDTAGRYVASVFDVVHDAAGRVHAYVAKDKLRLLDRSWNQRHGARDTRGLDNGRDKIDTFVVHPRDVQVARATARVQRVGGPHLTLAHFAGPDVAGHRFGGMSQRYLAAVRRVDRHVGRILDAIARRPAVRDQTLVILSSDHGTAARTHSDARRPANYRIPFMVWGSGVAAGTDLYGLNPDRARPGGRRVSYRSTPPVRNGDAANLALSHLGLPPVPGSEFSRTSTLRTSRPLERFVQTR